MSLSSNWPGKRTFNPSIGVRVPLAIPDLESARSDCLAPMAGALERGYSGFDSRRQLGVTAHHSPVLVVRTAMELDTGRPFRLEAQDTGRSGRKRWFESIKGHQFSKRLNAGWNYNDGPKVANTFLSVSGRCSEQADSNEGCVPRRGSNLNRRPYAKGMRKHFW